MIINKIYIEKNLLNIKGQLRTSLFREDSKWYRENQHIIENIYNQTSFLNQTHDIKERLYIIYHNLTIDDIICPSCKTNIKKFITFNKGYRKYCCKECGDRDINRINKIKSSKKIKYGDETFNNRDKAKNTVKEKYGVENVSQIKEVKEKAIKTAINKYGSVFNKNRVKDSLLDRFGVDNPMKVEDIKDKSMNSRKDKYGTLNNFEKIKETNRKKYGVDLPLQSNEVREKLKKISLEKYGVEYPMKNDDIKSRVKETKLERYGDPNYNNIEKVKKTNLEKYGVAHINQKNIKHYDQWIENKKFIEIYNRYDNIDDICNYFNVSPFPVYKRARSLNLLYKPNRRDITIKKIGQIIKQYGYQIEYNNRSIIKPLEIDIVIRRDNNIVKCLEYNGIMFHSLGTSSVPMFNNWNRYRDNLESFFIKDRIKLDRCRQLDIELFILREDIYLNDSNIIEKWLNNQLNYKILDQPVIYRFKTMNNLETISIEDVVSSIENGYRVYFDWIEISQ